MKLKDVKNLKKGDTVRWSSQANGSTLEKVGTVVCHVPRGANVLLVAEAAGAPIESNANLMCVRKAIAHERVLVRVTTTTRRGTRVDYYAPPVHRLAARGELVK